MVLRKSNGGGGDLLRPHSRFDQGKLPSLESSLDWAPTAPQAPVIAMRPTAPAFQCFRPGASGLRSGEQEEDKTAEAIRSGFRQTPWFFV
jgi:hypothetical protein